MKFLARTVLPFVCGAVTAVNLSLLVGVNPNYEAEWWKIAIALACAALSYHASELMD
jgi:hypothetical protein